jgi:hypothetical protein
VTVEVAGADHHRVQIAAVGESAAEAGVDADVHEHSARPQDPGHLAQVVDLGIYASWWTNLRTKKC